MEPPIANTISDNSEKKIEFTWKNEKKRNNNNNINSKKWNKIFFRNNKRFNQQNKILIFIFKKKIKQINPYLFLCKTIEDGIEEIKNLINEQKNTFI